MDFKLIFRVEKIPVASDIIYSRPYRKGGGDYRHYKRKETLGREHYRFKQNDDYTKELRNRFYFTKELAATVIPDSRDTTRRMDVTASSRNTIMNVVHRKTL